MVASDEYESDLVGAIDEGTSSTRFLVFSAKTFQVITHHQIQLNDLRPNPGWVEIDAVEILEATLECMRQTCEKLRALKFDLSRIKAIGITNQRETIVAWDRRTGKPLHNAIVWCDTRTDELADIYTKKAGRKNAFQKRCGLFIHPYFSALKLRWLIDNITEVEMAAKDGNLSVGTVDTWLIWNLTHKVFVTDVTNASRTLLMNIRSFDWDRKLLKFFDFRREFFADIKSSSEIYGHVKSGLPLAGVPLSGCLGDQQAALVGESCFDPAMCKNTYGSGCFLLANTGRRPAFSNHGLLTTIAYKFGPDQPAYYALEGSVAAAGLCVDWLKDNLNLFKNYEESESFITETDNAGGVYFVPAFSGLYAPYWHSQARGIMCGLTLFTQRRHVVRAAYEAVCYQTRDILEAMCRDNQGSPPLNEIRLMCDGGMSRSDSLMQMQADLSGAKVIRAQHPEATALGAAIAAGLAQGVQLWTFDQVCEQPLVADEFRPKLNAYERDSKYHKWKEAVRRSKYWTSDHQTRSFRPDSILGNFWAHSITSIFIPSLGFLTGVLATVLIFKLARR